MSPILLERSAALCAHLCVMTYSTIPRGLPHYWRWTARSPHLRVVSLGVYLSAVGKGRIPLCASERQKGREGGEEGDSVGV